MELHARAERPRSRRWWGVVRMGMAVLLILAVAGLWERSAGRARVAMEYGRLRAAGEPTNVSGLLPVALPEASNAWVALQPWTNQLSAFTGAVLRVQSWRWSAPGTLARDPLPARAATGFAAAADVLADLVAHAPLRRAVVEAVALSGYWVAHPYTNGFSDLPTDATYGVRLGHLLVASASEALARGDAVEAARDLEALLNLAGHEERQPLLISGMVAASLTQLAVPVTARLLALDHVPEPLLARIQERWARLQPALGLERRLVFERTLAIQHDARLRASAAARAKAAEWPAEAAEAFGIEAPSLAGRLLRAAVQEPLWPWIWCDHDLAWQLRHWANRLHVARTGRHAGWSAAWHDIAALDVKGGSLTGVEWGDVKGPTWLDRLRCRFSLGGPSFFPESTWVRSSVRAEAAARLSEVAVAVRRFEMQRGRPPRAVAELAPGFLEREPRDPLDLQPMRLEFSQGRARPYSVGPDGEDDGASCEVDEGETYRTPMDGRDWVFPLVER